MPLKGLNTESKISALSGALGSPFGAGIRSNIAVKISSTPKPVLPLAGIISLLSHNINSSIWSFTSSGIAPGKSILFRIGIIVSS